eukprot:COSAG04_NODE_7688_length_1087_cov_1.012146_2_plen_36_part_01
MQERKGQLGTIASQLSEQKTQMDNIEGMLKQLLSCA